MSVVGCRLSVVSKEDKDTRRMHRALGGFTDASRTVGGAHATFRWRRLRGRPARASRDSKAGLCTPRREQSGALHCGGRAGATSWRSLSATAARPRSLQTGDQRGVFTFQRSAGTPGGGHVTPHLPGRGGVGRNAGRADFAGSCRLSVFSCQLKTDEPELPATRAGPSRVFRTCGARDKRGKGFPRERVREGILAPARPAGGRPPKLSHRRAVARARAAAQGRAGLGVPPPGRRKSSTDA